MFGQKNEYEKINQMLDAAIAGNFSEELFDESELSKLQTKFMRYLTAASMSEHKLAEERAKLQELITNISHQTKTPLTNIKLYSDLLLERMTEGEEKEYVKEISMHTEKLEHLIGALVKMSRLETGIFRFQQKICDLSDLLKSLGDTYGNVAREKKIDLVCRLDRGHTAYIDAKWTKEAVGNILDNAVKYSGENTTVVLSSFQYEMFSGIRVEDRGVGIAEEDIPRIFGRFYRGKSVSDREGIGVGLYLAREIVEGQGGYIKVSSKPGEGSVFEIFMPCHR